VLYQDTSGAWEPWELIPPTLLPEEEPPPQPARAIERDARLAATTFFIFIAIILVSLSKSKAKSST
jgi:hypothetical protein